MSDNTPTDPQTPLPRRNGSRQSMTWQEVVYAALPYAGASALVVALALFALKSGAEVDATLIGAIIAGAVAVLSLILSRRSTGGGGATAAAASVLLLAGVSLLAGTGCNGLNVPEGYRCEAEATSVAVVGAVVESVERDLPEDFDGRDEAISYARGGLEIGDAAVEACRTVAIDDDAPAWRRWLGVALKGLRGVVAILVAAGVPVPGVIESVISSLATLFAAANQAGGVV